MNDHALDFDFVFLCYKMRRALFFFSTHGINILCTINIDSSWEMKKKRFRLFGIFGVCRDVNSPSMVG